MNNNSEPNATQQSPFIGLRDNPSFQHYLFNIISIVLSALAITFVVSEGEPHDVSELTSLIYMFTGSLCSVILLIRPLAFLSERRAQPLGTVLIQLISFMLLMHTIKNDGDGLIELGKQYPTHVFAFGLSVIFVLFINKLGSRYFYVQNEAYTSASYSMCTPKSQIKPSHRDLEVARIHEAGHALIYAATSPYPSNLQVTVFESFQGSGVLGKTTFPNTCHMYYQANELNIFMYLTLAGLAAEKAYFNEHFSGGSSDLIMWESYANQYFAGGFSQIPYILAPKTKQEVLLNSNSLNELRSYQLDNLHEFFVTNRVVLLDLSHALKEAGSIDAEALRPFLDKVELPEWLPEVNLQD
ncbi:hypothetical protein ACRN9F_21350 [Shewanella oncorhynchi]|uniref:hypothetical protein n=1 Tax=Shewanella oncorhynchi TaxID=2726434 RepID=UPI003D793EBF